MSNVLPPNAPLHIPDGGQDDGDDQVARAIVRYLNDMLPADEAQRLCRRLDGDVRLQDLFVSLARLHGLMSEWGHAMAVDRGSHTWDLFDEEDVNGAANGATAPSLHDALVQPAIHEVDVNDDDADARPIRLPPTLKPIPPHQTSRRPLWWMIGTAAAAGVAVVLIPALRHRTPPNAVALQGQRPVVSDPPTVVAPARPPAVISAVAGAVLVDWPALRPDMPFAVGQRLNLQAGAIEIAFNSGAVVTVSAPARVRVVDRNRMALEAGSLAAHVPPSAVGFRVDGPELAVIDRGTDFGLRSRRGDAGTEVDVFKGVVDAMAPNADVATAMRVTGGNAVACGSGDGGVPHPTPYAPKAFVRTVDEYRVTVPLHGTGADVPFGSPDPHWTLVSVPKGPTTRPMPTFPVEMDPTRFFPISPTAKWITPSPRVADAPAGLFTFRTTVTLPAFAPGTATVTGTWGADEQVSDVIVNGISTAPMNARVIGEGTRTQPATWAIQGAPWRAGDNRVDVVVWNKPVPKGVLNQTALNVSWTATLAPVVRRSNDPDPAPTATPPGSGKRTPPAAAPGS